MKSRIRGPLIFNQSRAQKPPYLLIDASEINPNDIYNSAIQRKESFSPSAVLSSDYKFGYDLNHRCSSSLRDRKTVYSLAVPVLKIIAREHNFILEALGIPAFSNFTTRCDCVAFKDGDFFHTHQDSAPFELFRRRYTWVYYFHKEPRSFLGGDLLFFDGSKTVGQVQPKAGTLVVFSVKTPHAVSMVNVPSKEFCDSRFALTGFVGKNASLGYRVLSKVVRTNITIFNSIRNTKLRVY